tara:strand:- start:9522 stop:10652 length:1131 start_codon:yes stop_codon:yes gene_type:complete
MTNFKFIIAITFSLYTADAFSANAFPASVEESAAAASSRVVTPSQLISVQGPDGQYRTSPAAFKAAYDSLHDAVRSTAEGKRLSILELGFGTLDSSAALSVAKEFPGMTSVTLLDNNPESTARAAQGFARFGVTDPVLLTGASIPGVFFTTDIDEKIEDESQDIVYASWVLHFLQPLQYVKAIKGIHRVLKPGGKLIYAGRSTKDPKWLQAEYSFLARNLGRGWTASHSREALMAKGNDVSKPWGGNLVHPAVSAYMETARKFQGTAVFCDISAENLSRLMRNLGFEVESTEDLETPEFELRQLGGGNSKATFHYTAGVFIKSEVTPDNEAIVDAGLRSHLERLAAAKEDPSYTAAAAAVKKVIAQMIFRANFRKV